jgi:hypothetical protein
MTSRISGAGAPSRRTFGTASRAAPGPSTQSFAYKPAPAPSGAPWHNPDSGSLAGTRRAILPAIWATIALTALQLAVVLTSMSATGKPAGLDLLIIIFAVIGVFTGAILLFAYHASRIACYLMAGTSVKSALDGLSVLGNEPISAALAFIIGAVMLVLWIIAAKAAGRYHQSLKFSAY